MKTLLSLVLIFISCGRMLAQEINCDDKQKQLSSAVNDSDFKKGFEILSEIKVKCAAKSEEIYLLGIKVFQYQIEMAASDAKEVAVRDLIKWYDQYDKNFPDNKNGNLVNKAMVLYDNRIASENEIYGNLDKAFSVNKYQFSNPNALYTYFKLYKEKYDDKNNKMSFEQLLDKYSATLEVIEKNRVQFPEKEVEFSNAHLAITSLVKNDITRENVIPYAETKFASNNENISWLESTATLLSQKSPSTPIFGSVANQLHRLKPTSKSAYHLGNFNLKTRNQSKAIEYFLESATLSKDNLEKAQIYYTLANITAANDLSKSKEMLKLAIENNPSNGEYYIFLSNLYANSGTTCATTDIEKKAINLLAKQAITKAAQVQPKFKANADQFSKKYEAPTQQELSAIKKNGNKVVIGCWINETVQF